MKKKNPRAAARKRSGAPQFVRSMFVSQLLQAGQNVSLTAMRARAGSAEPQNEMTEVAKTYSALHVINGYAGFVVAKPADLARAILWPAKEIQKQRILARINTGGPRAPIEVGFQDVGLKWTDLTLEAMTACKTRGTLTQAIRDCYAI